MDHCHIEFDESELLDKADKLTPWDGGDTPVEKWAHATEGIGHQIHPELPMLDVPTLQQKDFHRHLPPMGSGDPIIDGAPGWDVYLGDMQYYGAMMANDKGHVLLVKDKNGKWGYPEQKSLGPNVSAYDTAAQAVILQTGHVPMPFSVVPGTFQDINTANQYNYLMMYSQDFQPNILESSDTQDIRWVNNVEARELLKESYGDKSMAYFRHVEALDAAMAHVPQLLQGKTDHKYIEDLIDLGTKIKWTDPDKLGPETIEPVPDTKPDEPVPWGEGGFAPVDEPEKPTMLEILEKEAAKPPFKEPVFIEPIGHQLPLPFPPDLRQLDKKKTEFPALEDLDSLIEVQDLGGSTGAKLVEDPLTGKRYVLKRGADPGHVIEEMYADAAYQAAGVRVPEFQAYNTEHGPVKLAEFIPNARSLGDVLRSGTVAEIMATKADLQDNFAADVLMGNWDAMGLDFDNVLIDERGYAWRIDNGGSFRRRAQGAMKGAAWNQYPEELWTLRTKNESMSAIFAEMTWDEIVTSMERINAKEDKILKELPDFLQDDVKARIAIFKDLVSTSHTMREDNWTQPYLDDFARHMVGLKKAGIEDRFPAQMDQEDGWGTTLVDEHGTRWDNLRGSGSIMQDVWNYIDTIEGDTDILERWMMEQGYDSWDDFPRYVKYWITQSRLTDTEDVYWGAHDGNNLESIRRESEAFFDRNPKFNQTFTTWHAFNYMLARSVDTEVHGGGTMTIARTEPRHILERNGLEVGDSGVTIPRGLAESGSIHQAVVVNGKELTIQEVPYHRILGLYWYERTPGSRQTPFYGDNENEVVFIPDKLEFEWVGGVRDGEDLDDYR